MGLFSRKQRAQPGGVDPRCAQALSAVDDGLSRLPGGLRAVAYRTKHGEMEIAIVVPGDNLPEALDPLSPTPIRALMEREFGFAGLYVVGRYYTQPMWREGRLNDWYEPETLS